MLLVLPSVVRVRTVWFLLGLVSPFLSLVLAFSLYLPLLSSLLRVDSDLPHSSKAHDAAQKREDIHEREGSFVSSCLKASFCILCACLCPIPGVVLFFFVY